MMDYGKLTPLLAKAIQDLKAEKDEEVDQLKSQVELLVQQVQQLQQQVSSLQANSGSGI